MRANKLIILPILAALIIANMGAIAIVGAAIPPPEYLYCDGYDGTFADWTAVGASPYLDAPDDGNYIEATSDGALMGYFTFEDIAPIPSDAMIDKVWLEAYTDGPHSDDVDFDAYSAGLGIWLGSLYADDEPKWVRPRWIAPDQPISDFDANLLSRAGLNAWKMAVYLYDPGGVVAPGNIIDSLRLYVTYTAYIPPVPIMAVSPEVNTAEVCETFSIEIMIPPDPYTPVYDLYGYEFKLAYNPAVITGTEIVLGDFFPPNAVEWMKSIDNEAGVIWYSVTMPFGAEKGVSGSGVLAVITFHVEAVGVSGLDIYGTMMGNRYGLPIAHITKDGVFANSENFAVCIKTAHREHRRFSISGDEDGYQELSATIKNYGDVTQAYAKFTIFDGMGAPVYEDQSETVALSPNEMTTLGIAWKPPEATEDYSVEAQVWYMDHTGTFVVGRKGDPSGVKDLMTIYFRVEL